MGIHVKFCSSFFVSMTIAWGFGVPVSASPPTIGGCPIFPANNIWNTPIDTMPVSTRSDDYIASIGANTSLHPDFGEPYLVSGGLTPIGIPYIIVPGSQARVPVQFNYDSESDPGPYPIPPDAPIEGVPDWNINHDGDRHILVLDRDNCVLYETFYSWPNSDGSWSAGSGAVFDLNSNELRPDGWTSADAAGLPILPGLVRYDEVAAGVVNHAIRFTADDTRNEYVWPARHKASSLTDQRYPPLGQRFRLKSNVDISGFSQPTRVILQAMKKYGIILADNGSNWFISGTGDDRWDNDTLVGEFRQLKGSDFEAVDVSSLMIAPNSGQAREEGSDPSGRLPLWRYILLIDPPPAATTD
jgi:hypothetical protein